MDCMSVGSVVSRARRRLTPDGKGCEAAAVAFFLAAGGLIAAAAPSRATPVAPPRDPLAAAPPILVRDYCGHGYHRENKQRNKAGAWVGKCVPNKPKKTQPPAAHGTATGQSSEQRQNPAG